MFGGFFNRMYYGDPRRPDLKKEDTKTNRIKMFFTVLQIRFWQLIQLNLLLSVFWIPAFFLINAQLILSQESNEPFSMMFYLLMTLCLMLAGPATAAATYIIRNWARDEHSWVWSDFKDAWKENWKQSVAIMLINGILLLLFSVNISFYGNMAGENFFFVFLYYFMLMIAIVFLMMNMFIFPMIVTYKLTLRQILKNAFILTMVKLPLTFGIFLLAFGIVFLSALYLLSLPVFIIGLTLPAFIVISYTNWIFDKYINNRAPVDEEDQI